ncbi:Histone-lysine N-methyltransferase ASHH2 [Dichanthelium oligosanthes]|uniref:Histone-lysine N-methyltransferase ASHH2 n=1 Tax=Dichanthelium oligosanthes TaxID=888268 RepID=A0A1E5VI16_9POAL|nr:Histone-lysine N-methyltransferase ASHH2 [Dichanthelium oligosanthes]
MEEPGAGTRGREDRAADAARLGGAENALPAAAATALAPVTATEVCGAPEARLSTEVDEEKGGDFAAGLVTPVEAVSAASFEGRRFQMDQGKGSSLEKRVMEVEEEKGGSLPPTQWSTAEPGGLQTCHEGNGGLSNSTLCAPCGEAVCPKDTGCMYGVLEKTAGGSQFDLEGLVGNGGNLGGEAQVVKATLEDLRIAHDDAKCDYAGLLHSMNHENHGSEQEPCAVDCIGSITDANDELQQDGLMPDIEAEVSRPVREDSVPSVSGGIDLSLDGNTSQFGGISGDSMMFPVSDRRMWNGSLCAAAGGKESQFIDARCMSDTVDMATEGRPCQLDILAGGGGVSSGVVEDIQTCYKEPNCGNEGLPDLANHDIELLPCSMGAKKNAIRDLEKDGLLPKIGADSSSTLHEDLVPSISGSSAAVSLDGKAGQIGELSEHRSSMENMAFSSEGCGTFSCESAFHKEAPGDEVRCSVRKVNTSEEDLRTDWMEAAHDNGDLSDLGKHYSEKLPCDTDGLPLITDANHELQKGGFLPNINAIASCPVDETSVPLDGQVAQAVDTSENSACLEKLVCDSLEGDMMLCKSGLLMEAYVDENQHSGPCADKDLQHISLKYGTSELPPKGNLCVSSYNQPCDNEPCCGGKESSALSLGHQDSAVGGSIHLDQGLNACNPADDSSVDFVSSANDGESQKQKQIPLFVFRRRNPKRAASSRRDSEKPDQMNKTSSGTRKPKKVDIASSFQQSTMSMFPNKITKGRSGMNRPSKASTWGSLKELLGGFYQSCGPSTSNSKPICLDKGRSNNRSDQKSIRKSRSSRSSKIKCSSLSVTGHAASGLNGQLTLSTVAYIGHAATELNGQPPFSTMADTDVSFEIHRGNMPKLSSDTSINIFDSTSNTAESTDSYHTVKSKCKTDTQLLERASVSSTKETCTSCAHGECAKLSTSEPSLTNANGSVMLHVGLSPDSVLEVASVTCEGNASASHDAMLHENSINTGALNDGYYHPSVLSISEFGKEQALSLMNLEQQAKTTLHEDTRKEEISPSHAMGDNDVGKGKAQALQKSNAVRKISIVRKPGCKKKDGPKGKVKNVIGATKNSPCEASKPRPFSSNSISPDPSESFLRTGPPEVGSGFEALTSGTKDHAVHEHDSIWSHSVMNGDKGSAFDSMKSPRRKKKDANAGKKGKARDPHKKEKSKKKNIADDTSLDHGLLNLPSTDLAASHMNEQSNLDPAMEFAGAISTDLPGNVTCKMDGASVPPPPRAAWVCCDDCQKWRCIPAELVDVIGETRCLLMFLINYDQSMVCNCKPPQDGRLGCRDGCLNRVLNIECVKRTCPCGEQCSNQKFQRRSYAKLRWFHSGKKGYGLQLQEDVTEGRFLIEYVGEVLDITSYESRQRYYASKGQKHFYFMALNGGEWMVNGEVCIGIFAMRNIKKGEELTFDYNYVRVSGAAPQKCYCGTAKCRGYIGGDTPVVDTVTQDDADAGHFEQIVVYKDSEELMGANGSDSDVSHPNIAGPELSIQGEDLHDCSAAKAELEPLEQTVGTLVETSEPENSLNAWSPQEDEDVIRTPVHVSRTFESSLQQFPGNGTQSSDLLQKTAKSTEGSKAPNVINGSTPSSDFRSNLVPGFNANKRNNLKQHRNAKPQSPFPIDNEHIFGVEGRLNNLLDGNGGISKRKDATNGYLKLLFVTAAEGDSAGGTSKSVRDLSLILDALLKTKSHSVLLDIINKNGLQMLHNILKQNRNNFHRIPIIRKLLKVLEFLAQRGILTSEHINGGPRCAGVESFRESMLSLVRHKNFQVQQIARSFRDTWILCNNGRGEPTEYPHASTFAQDIQGTNMAWSSARRKRKSRWDYQPDEHYKMVGLKIQKVCSGHGEFDVQCGFMGNKLRRNQGTNNCHNDVRGMGSSTEGADDEVPPGFESQQECQPAQLSIGSEVARGLCMERYQPSLSISYGVPVDLVQHFGTPESEGGQCHQKWKVAPGVPFSPFPPLPPYPRGSPCPSTSSSQVFQHDGTPPVDHNSSGHCGRTTGRDGRVHRTWRNGPRTKWPYHHQGRRFSSNHHKFERFEPPRTQ